ncbi:hypothetical protein FSARC_7147 [Fusarium sarcochroum]|uniref:Protein kinase domain-containing protein n=1 Tax=Fusarium sarcochroum TaxID=1208366 RepID=A0A8H4X8J2_9HYPO|nr:hypothetical protein FSARC_7147 [Fusarium sarcochroum]
MVHSHDNPGLHPADDASRNEEYFAFIEKNLSEGVNGYGHHVWFVRTSILRQWWTEPGGRRIPRALDLQNGIDNNVIIDCYLIIFSILVFIGKPHYIHEFVRQGYTDARLPFVNPPRVFGTDPAMVDMLRLFRDRQWKFCPVQFSKGMVRKFIDPRQILPIMESKLLRSSPKSTIKVVKLYPDCYDSGWAPSDTIVFKEFRTNEDNTLRYAWARECNALAHIGPCDQIVQYLGSFEQKDRCFVMLEYANGGSLLDLFKRDTLPQTITEIQRVQKSLMSLLLAINRIHNLKLRAEDQRTGFAHRDINPENILVFQDKDDPFSKDFKVKLADFDTATAAQVIDSTESGPQDNNGNRTYSPPEASRQHKAQEVDLMQVSIDCDIWSLGCVLADALVWLPGGWIAVQTAEQDRKTTIAASHKHLIGGGYGSCFHDGQALLPCVLRSHQAALASLPSTDGISQRVSDLIERMMLQPSSSRVKRSMDIWNEFDKLSMDPVANQPYPEQRSSSRPFSSPPAASSPNTYNRQSSFGDGLMTLSPSTTNQIVPDPDLSLSTLGLGSPVAHNRASLPASPSPISPGSRLETPTATYPPSRSSSFDKRLVENKDLPPSQVSNGGSSHTALHQQEPHAHPEQTSVLFPNKFVSDIINCRRSRQAREEILGFERFKQTIQPRHFIIVIDDSTLMRAIEQVMDIAESLVWLLKPIDSLGVEIRLTSNPNKRYQLNPKAFRSKIFRLPQTTESFFKPIREWFRGERGSGPCNMEFALNKIFREAGVVNPDHPTSVLVLTNGIWEGGCNRGDNIKGTIAHVVKQMESMNMLRTEFTIQFVSFGNDPIGIGRLDYVDDNPPKNSQGEKWDIVDHKRHTDNVWKILWGAASEAVDGS